MWKDYKGVNPILSGIYWGLDRSIRLAVVYLVLKIWSWLTPDGDTPDGDTPDISLGRPLSDMTVEDFSVLMMLTAITAVFFAALLWPDVNSKETS